MKPEDHAWCLLRVRAAGVLPRDFAVRVLRSTREPSPAAWLRLRETGAARIRSGFAGRVLAAARRIPGVPALLDQFAFSAATAAVCLVAVVLAHSLSVRIEDERNLAGWQQLADVLEEIENFQ